MQPEIAAVIKMGASAERPKGMKEYFPPPLGAIPQGLGFGSNKTTQRRRIDNVRNSMEVAASGTVTNGSGKYSQRLEDGHLAS